MRLKFSTPKKSKEYQNQTDLESITKQEYENTCKPFRFSILAVLYQIFCCIFVLTPLRIIISTVVIIFMIVSLLIVHYFVSLLQISPEAGRQFCLLIERCGIRVLLFSFGILYIKVDGHFDQRTRIIISNHVSILEPFILLLYHDLCFPLFENWYSNPIIKILLESFDVIYLPHSKLKSQTGNSKICTLILAAADDMNRPPLLIFPEGLKSNCCGDILMKFNKMAFMTPYRVQPVVIRYTMLGVPEGLNTYQYRGESILGYLWRLHTIPLGYLTISLMQSTALGKCEDMSIDTFAQETQLIMANFIGIPAINADESTFLG